MWARYWQGRLPAVHRGARFEDLPAKIRVGLCLVSVIVTGCASNTGDPFNANAISRLPVLISSPANGATGVDTRAIVTVSFTGDVDPATLREENLILQEGARTLAQAQLVDRSFVFSAARREVSIFPRNPLKPNTAYQVVIQGMRTPDQVVFETTTFVFVTGAGGNPPVLRGQLRDSRNRVRPLADAANVDPRSSIELIFSRAMDPTSVTSAFSISPRVVGTFSLEQGNSMLVFAHPGSPFPLGQAVVVMVGADARDASPERVRLGANFVARFTTPDPQAFQLIAIDPPRQTPPVRAKADAPVRITFSESVDIGSARQNIRFEPASASPITTFESRDQVVLITHANIPANTPVTVTIGKDLVNMVGVTFGQANAGRDFVVDYVIESVPPKLIERDSTIPANGARNVSPNTKITFNFDEKLDPATVNENTFTVTRGGNKIQGTVALSTSGQSVVFTPTTTLRADANPVVATATTGIKDLGGTAVAANISISFFIDNTPPTLAFTDPPNGATEIEVNRFSSQPIVVDFSEAVDQGLTRLSIAPSPLSTRTGAGGAITFGSTTRLLYTTAAVLLGNTRYTVTIATQDLAGNATPSPLVFAFRTDATPPQVNTGTLSPPPGAVNQPRQPAIGVEFTELMNVDTVKRAFSLTSQGQTFGATSGTLVFGESGTLPRRTSLTYTLNLGQQLPANAIVNININREATDLGLTALATPFLSTFSTGP